MGAQEFGQLVETERLARGWTRGKLAVAVGILNDGSALDATQIRRIVEGTRKLDQDIVSRLIHALTLNPDTAWHAAGLWPPDLDVEEYRKLRLASAANGVTARKVAQPLPLDVNATEFAQLIDQNRPRLAVVVPLAPRRDRRQEDRRRLRALPDVAA